MTFVLTPRTFLWHDYETFGTNVRRDRPSQFAAQIEQALSLPGAIGVGYNTIRFDDEVSRFMFWRNLIDPYAREWQNDCGRWEAHRAARLFDGADGARTVQALSVEIDQLSETADERGEAILSALYDYAEVIAPLRE